MAAMLMTAKSRGLNHGKYLQGPGGRYCVCCDPAPKWTRRVRRSVKRSERQGWKRDLSA